MTSNTVATGDPSSPDRTEARTFVVLAIGGGFTAWDLGFDLGAFGTIDHRRFWAVWILCTIALVASYLFRSAELESIGRWRFVFLVPTLWLLADFLLTDDSGAVTVVLSLVSVATLPVAVYLLFQLLAGDFFALRRRPQLVLAALTVGIFLVRLYVGQGHERFLTCDDFERVGDYVPANCTP